MENCTSTFSSCFEAIPSVASRSFLIDVLRLLPRKSKCLQKGFTCLKSVGEEDKFPGNFNSFVLCLDNESVDEVEVRNCLVGC